MQAQPFAQSRSDQTLGLALVIGLHVLAGAGLLMLAQPVLMQVFSQPIQVQFLTEQPKPETIAPPQPEPPKPLPVKQQLVQPRQVQPKPAPAPVIQADAPAAPDAPVMTAPPAPKELPPAAPPPAPRSPRRRPIRSLAMMRTTCAIPRRAIPAPRVRWVRKARCACASKSAPKASRCRC